MNFVGFADKGGDGVSWNEGAATGLRLCQATR